MIETLFAVRKHLIVLSSPKSAAPDYNRPIYKGLNPDFEDVYVGAEPIGSGRAIHVGGIYEN